VSLWLIPLAIHATGYCYKAGAHAYVQKKGGRMINSARLPMSA
jgi:hypothetical protein